MQFSAILLAIWCSAKGATKPTHVSAGSIVDSIESIRFESSKTDIDSLIRQTIKKKYTVSVVVDSISLENYYYDDSKEGWIDRIEERDYFAWVHSTQGAYKYSFSVKNKTLSNLAEITNTSFGDKKLDQIKKLVSLIRDSLKIAKQKDDAITDSLLKIEDLAFKRDSAKLRLKIAAHFKKSHKIVAIDSIAFTDFSWSLESGSPKVSSKEYVVWLILDNNEIGRYKACFDSAKQITVSFDSTEYNSDEKVRRMIQSFFDKKIKAAEIRYKKNASVINSAILKCLKEHANDPSSVQFISAFVEDVRDDSVIYRVRMRGKNGFGALMLGSNSVTLASNNSCMDIE